MVGTILLTILDFFVSIGSKIVGIIVEPVANLFFNYVYGIDDFITYADTYIDNYVLPGVAFAKNVICNITGLSPGFFGVIATICFFMFGMWGLFLSVRFVFNLTGLVRFGRGSYKVIK